MRLTNLCCLLALALPLGACTVHQTDVPSLAGPSGLGTTVTVTAVPDVLVMGPVSAASGDVSVITVKIRDASGHPVVGRTVRFGTGDSAPSGCGLQSASVVTNADGNAITTFVAPGFPATGVCEGLPGPPTVVIVNVVPDGSDFQATADLERHVQIQLVRPVAF